MVSITKVAALSYCQTQELVSLSGFVRLSKACKLYGLYSRSNKSSLSKCWSHVGHHPHLPAYLLLPFTSSFQVLTRAMYTSAFTHLPSSNTSACHPSIHLSILKTSARIKCILQFSTTTDFHEAQILKHCRNMIVCFCSISLPLFCF